MNKINEPIPESEIIANLKEAKEFSKRVSYPIIIRPAYTLGGSGGGIATDELTFTELVTSGLRRQFLVVTLFPMDFLRLLVYAWQERILL